MKLRRALSVLCWLGVAACGSTQTVDPTQTVIVVDAEAGVAQRADSLVVTITSAMSSEKLHEETALRSDGTLVWPYVLALAPRDGDSSRRFNVYIEARDGDGNFVSAVRAISGYAAKQRLLLHLTLEDDCIGVTCKSDETCEGAKCKSAEVPVASLGTFEPSKDAPHSVVVPGVDASTPLDGGEDAARDASTTPGCVPNPNKADEICPEICPELCNGKDDDCDLHIDEDADDSCQLPHAMGACVNHICVVLDCVGEYRDCDMMQLNGCEASIEDVNNCGSCGHKCDISHAESGCHQGKCVQTACDPLYGDCNGDRNGCEVHLNTLDDCGACGVECGGVPHATPGCATGKCGVGTCDDGYGDCDHSGGNGCEQELNTLANCGGCGEECDFPGSTGDFCDLKKCLAGTCSQGFKECDGDPSNGCESLSSDAHCGDCVGHKCDDTLMNVTTAACGGTGCTISKCDVGFGDCDNNPFNGCESSVKSTSSCGACGAPCTIPHAVTSCSTGTCTFVRCQDGWADCANGMADGCEQDLNDPATCGSCSNDCSLAGGMPYCSGGHCSGTNCAAGTADCDNAGGTCEVTLASDAQHCGSCANVCAFDGNAGPPHASSLMCASGSCQPVCDAGYGDCNGNYADGCETSLRTLTDCGACGVGCAIANAAATCSTGTCEVNNCSADLGNCDSNAADCETALDTTANCGGCGVICDLPNAVEACSGSAGARTCTITACNAGFDDCDANMADGCETSLNT
ncbi:MAG TPA: hypothetical protein VHM19_07035, partial [Polyangiales bacterium]|nr:hypothetical protein [Polyangiales bacterium]